MKTSTALIIGAAAVGILFIWSRSKSSTLPIGAKPSSTLGSLLTLGGAALGGAAVTLFSPGALSSTSTNTTSSVAQQNSADYSQLSNYTADQTAASDTSSGVVGFGGWDS